MCFSCGKESVKYWGELERYQKKYKGLNKSDLYRMIEWFHKHSIDGFMDKGEFLEAMGFTSRAGYIFERMFRVMDQNNDGKVDFSMLV